MAFSPSQHGSLNHCKSMKFRQTCQIIGYNHVPVPCDVANDHQEATTLWFSHTKYFVARKEQEIIISFLFKFPFFKFHQNVPTAPLWWSSRDSRLIITYWLWHVQSGGQMKKSLKTHLRLYFCWGQWGSGGRRNINDCPLKPLGVLYGVFWQRVL